jgi:hypothetical protein
MKYGIQIPEGWYDVNKGELKVLPLHLPHENLLEFQLNGGGEILELYRNSMKDALQKIYPEIAWQPWRFARLKEF